MRHASIEIPGMTAPPLVTRSASSPAANCCIGREMMGVWSGYVLPGLVAQTHRRLLLRNAFCCPNVDLVVSYALSGEEDLWHLVKERAALEGTSVQGASRSNAILSAWRHLQHRYRRIRGHHCRRHLFLLASMAHAFSNCTKEIGAKL
jgi:hypothetical protein